MKYILIVAIVLTAGPALAQQKTSKPKGKTCTYEQCVATNTGKGWSSTQVSNWCSSNPGKCE